ncbi:hypothetical protein EON64_13465, partial [archaeon]
MSFTTISHSVEACLVRGTVLVSSQSCLSLLQAAGFGTLLRDTCISENSEGTKDPGSQQVQLLLSEEETLYLMLQSKLSLHDAEETRIFAEGADKEGILSCEDFFRVCVQQDPLFSRRLAVYSHFRALNFVVRSALQFGGSFALYRAPPSRRHSEHLVLVLRGGEALTWRELSALTRIAPDVMKTLLLCWVRQEGEGEGAAQG